MIFENGLIRAQSSTFWPDFFIEDAVAFDIETYINEGIFGGMKMRTGKVFACTMTDTQPLDTDRLRAILRKNTILTFNGLNFDIPLTFLALSGAPMLEVKEAANHIITSGIKWWQVERELGIVIPKWLNHIDLMEVNPAVRQSLKVLNGRLHGQWMKDLPYHHDAVLTEDERPVLRRYWVNDLCATGLLAHNLTDNLKLRLEMGEKIDSDLRSKSDTQMGFAIIKHRVEDLRGERLKKSEAKTGRYFQYNVPDYMRFEDPRMNEILAKLREHQFVTKADGKVELPKWLSDPIDLHGTKYQMGIGGLHSTEANRSIVATPTVRMQDHDVASMYPTLILRQGLYPDALGRDFLEVYEGIYRDRLAAKAAKNKMVDKSLKLSLNGAYGLLGNRWSPLYAPNLLIAVTITGQLSLLMLIEMFERAGIKVVSANTDGVVTFTDISNTADIEKDRVGKSLLLEVIEAWEQRTGMKMESAEYTAIYNQSVNSYIALKPDGTHKRKGPIGNPWSSDPSENDVRGQMMKNPQMTICSDAVLAFLKHGTPIEQTIRECGDVRQFVTVVNATGGATWREEYLGKVVRYYWAIDGDPIIKVKGHPKTGNRPKVSKTDGSRPLMTLPDDFGVPGDLDYSRYEDEARAILKDIGWVPASTAQSPWEQLLRRAVQQGVE